MADYTITLNADPTTLLLLQELLKEYPVAVNLPEGPRKLGRLRIYCCSQKAAECAADRLRTLLCRMKCAPRRLSIRPTPRLDWAKYTRRFFRVKRISRRLAVKPVWCAYTPPKQVNVVELEPGLSFGTGLHPTTQACLRLLDEVATRAAPGSFLDAGCGSGILAIAAARLGYRPVLAFDNDPQAIRAAMSNILRNALRGRIVCRLAELSRFRCAGKFDCVAANLLAGVLIEAAPRLSRLVKQRGCLIASGILRDQLDDVLRAYQQRGFIAQKTIAQGVWRTVLFRHGTP